VDTKVDCKSGEAWCDLLLLKQDKVMNLKKGRLKFLSPRNSSRVLVGAVLGVSLLGFGPDARGQGAVFTGSLDIDYRTNFASEQAKDMLGRLSPEIAFKVATDVSDHISFAGKVCYGCHGFEIDRAFLEVTPWEELSLRVGRMSVPFGEFNTRHDRANHKSASKPIPYMMGHMPHRSYSKFNMGIIPVPYVDNVVSLFGTVWPSDWMQIYYEGYVAAGMRGSNDIDFKAMRAAYFSDNNRDVARGGRAILTFVDVPGLPNAFKDVSVGASVMNGAYDSNGELNYLAYGIDGTIRLGFNNSIVSNAVLRGEWVVRKTDLDPGQVPFCV
jgi:hypothetical protein